VNAQAQTALDPAVALAEMARIIAAPDVGEALEHIARFAGAVSGARRIVVALEDANDGRTSRVWPADLGNGNDPAIAAVAGGAPVPGSWLSVPLVSAGGKHIGFIAAGDRIDGPFGSHEEEALAALGAAAGVALERVRSVTELEEAQQQRQAFFGVISHELRTPITTIYGGSRVLRQSGSRLNHDARQQLLDDIAEEAERLYRLVEDLLVLSRAERDALVVAAEPILLQHVVTRVVASEQGRWPRARLRVSATAGLPPVLGDSTLVEQVVRNLVSNAAKYAGNSGPIEIQAEVQGEWVEVRVLDEGPGMTAAVAERVFDLFYRAPDAASQAQGAGIGLYACRQLVEAMGGSVWARARETVGAEFGFRLRADVGDDFPGTPIE
jgi:K+-sensing histidine kinase KdpD